MPFFTNQLFSPNPFLDTLEKVDKVVLGISKDHNTPFLCHFNRNHRAYPGIATSMCIVKVITSGTICPEQWTDRKQNKIGSSTHIIDLFGTT